LGLGVNSFTKFNATMLGLRGQPLVHLDLIEGSLAGVGEEGGSDFRGLASLTDLDIGANNIGSIAVDAFEGECLTPLALHIRSLTPPFSRRCRQSHSSLREWEQPHHSGSWPVRPHEAYPSCLSSRQPDRVTPAGHVQGSWGGES
jgi:hypothetical protein